jgi:hypothetical protein
MPATHAMDMNNENLDEQIYRLFLENKQTEARQILPRNQEKITSLFIYGINRDNANFMQWLLTTKKPLFDSLPIQESLRISQQNNHNEITYLLKNYIQNEREALSRELEKYIDTEIAKINNHQYYLDKTTDETPECKCIIS